LNWELTTDIIQQEEKESSKKKNILQYVKLFASVVKVNHKPTS